MKILLISTVDANGARLALFNRMVESVDEARRSLAGETLSLCVLFQNCSDARLIALKAEQPDFVECFAAPNLVPLSVARNRMLLPELAGGEVDAETLVAYPDDDAWYPKGLLEGVVSLFRDRADLDFWFCRYGSSPAAVGWDAADLTPASFRDVVRKSSSNTIFFRGSVAAAIGGFDEKLGLGAPLGSAEDIDYAIRAFKVARLSVLRDEILVGHRDKAPGLRGKYYAGSLYALARHRRHGGAGEFRRKLMIGLVLVLRRELPLARYLSAITAASGASRLL